MNTKEHDSDIIKRAIKKYTARWRAGKLRNFRLSFADWSSVEMYDPSNPPTWIRVYLHTSNGNLLATYRYYFKTNRLDFEREYIPVLHAWKLKETEAED